MRCNVFSLLKRFKFEKIEKNEFVPTMAKLVERSLRSRVKKNQNFRILLLERQSIQLSKTGCNLS